jgi:hypothetical protein
VGSPANLLLASSNKNCWSYWRARAVLSSVRPILVQSYSGVVNPILAMGMMSGAPAWELGHLVQPLPLGWQ